MTRRTALTATCPRCDGPRRECFKEVTSLWHGVLNSLFDDRNCRFSPPPCCSPASPFRHPARCAKAPCSATRVRFGKPLTENAFLSMRRSNPKADLIFHPDTPVGTEWALLPFDGAG